MFKCSCGGVLLVKSIYPIPSGLQGQEKLEYERKCDAECVECGKLIKDLKCD